MKNEIKWQCKSDILDIQINRHNILEWHVHSIRIKSIKMIKNWILKKDVYQYGRN